MPGKKRTKPGKIDTLLEVKKFAVRLNDIYFVDENRWSKSPVLHPEKEAFDLAEKLKKIYFGNVKVEKK